jgi:hypothetical protein
MQQRTCLLRWGLILLLLAVIGTTASLLGWREMSKAM